MTGNGELGMVRCHAWPGYQSQDELFGSNVLMKKIQVAHANFLTLRGTSVSCRPNFKVGEMRVLR